MLKGIGITLGSILLLIIIGLGALAFNFKSFGNNFEPFTIEILVQLSQNWDLGDVSEMIDEEAIEALMSPQSQASLQQFREMGKFIEAPETELLRYQTHTGIGTFGFFKINTKFENAIAEVTMTVKKDDDSIKLWAIHIDNIFFTNPAN